MVNNTIDIFNIQRFFVYINDLNNAIFDITIMFRCHCIYQNKNVLKFEART